MEPSRNLSELALIDQTSTVERDVAFPPINNKLSLVETFGRELERIENSSLSVDEKFKSVASIFKTLLQEGQDTCNRFFAEKESEKKTVKILSIHVQQLQEDKDKLHEANQEFVKNAGLEKLKNQIRDNKISELEQFQDQVIQTAKEAAAIFGVVGACAGSVALGVGSVVIPTVVIGSLTCIGIDRGTKLRKEFADEYKKEHPQASVDEINKHVDAKVTQYFDDQERMTKHDLGLNPAVD